MRPPILQKLNFIHSKMELFLDLIKNIFVAATRHFIKISINEMVCDLNKNDFLVGKRLK